MWNGTLFQSEIFVMVFRFFHQLRGLLVQDPGVLRGLRGHRTPLRLPPAQGPGLAKDTPRYKRTRKHKNQDFLSLKYLSKTVLWLQIWIGFRFSWILIWRQQGQSVTEKRKKKL
jgi:hypothetical protein